MTPQEQQLIDGLIQRVNGTNLTDKDAEAEQHLQQGFGRNPDALYILAQTVLVQTFALEQAQKQLADTRQQLAQGAAQPQKHTSFLGSIFGSSDPEPQRPSAPPPPPQQQPGYQPVPNQGYAQPQQTGYAPSFGAPGGGSMLGGSGGGGFLRGAMQTATGVAAGALAFEGVESLLHGFGNNMTGGSGLMGGGGRPEEVVNNYYGDGDGNSREGDRDNGNDRNFADNSDSSNDPSSNLFTDSGNDDSASNFGDNDDSGNDDSSSFDDGGSDSGSSDDSSF